MSSHSEESCPFEAVDWPVDLNRSNHFAHDVLGCPFECSDNHNHPAKAEDRQRAHP